MKTLSGGISNIVGFSSMAKHIGIKYKSKDLAVLYAEKPCVTAAVYTQNSVKGAPIYVNISHLQDHYAQAIVINSGNANVATGKQGLSDAHETAELAAKELGVKKSNVLVASTGIIGVELPMQKMKKGLQGIKGELKRHSDFAGAIMTTDTFEKEICVEYGGFKIAGVAKGSGMIEPNMATMLAFIITDADMDFDNLDRLLRNSSNKTFNMTSVDTDTSTSDMAVIMAGGKVKNVDMGKFAEALDIVCLELTKMIARDGEGATKLVVCDTIAAKTEDDARKIAKAVVSSPLVKTAVYGNDPNWGRLMMAIGKTGAYIDEENIDILINSQSIVEGGRASRNYDEQFLADLLKQSEEINIQINLNTGVHQAAAYGCDLSEEYIKINAEYTT